MAPNIRYVRSGSVAIAHPVVGDGDRDLVFVPDFCSNLVYAWESPYWRPFYDRLARSFRLILFDKRGTGLSDRGGAFPTLDTPATCTSRTASSSSRSGRTAPPTRR